MAKAIILHGGAGKWSLSPPERRERAKEVVEDCTKRGWKILVESDDPVKAVVEAIKCMEDSGVLNAGVGSVLDLLGGRGLDAGIMSSNGLLGAVGGVSATRNPIELARIVAEETPHILLVGSGADEFARIKKLPPLPPPPRRVVELYHKYIRELIGDKSTRPYIEAMRRFIEKNSVYRDFVESIAKLVISDTVGACAVNSRGLLVAGVSTGGLLLKLPGRVGDSSIPGAGFYADELVACSATGIGEKIIESMPCMRLSMEYANTRDLGRASSSVLEYVNKRVGTDTVGFIAVDREGGVAWRFNTEALLVGYAREGELYVKLEGLE
ncbi:MAG: isoaspartyl peptidase/L-asparaginase [Thermoprotei archaeon]